MQSNKLKQVNLKKTEVLLGKDGFALLLKEQVCSHGMLLDPGLLLDKQVTALGAFYQKQMARACREGGIIIIHLWFFLDRNDLATVVHTLLPSRLDYC